MTILTIEGNVPPSPNVIKRRYRNPHAYRRLRMAWELLVVGAAPSPTHRTRLKEQAKLDGKLFIHTTFYHNGTFDADNLQGAQKVLLDALVNVGYLKNDSPSHLLLYPATQVQVKRTQIKTVVKIGVVD